MKTPNEKGFLSYAFLLRLLGVSWLGNLGFMYSKYWPVTQMPQNGWWFWNNSKSLGSIFFLAVLLPLLAVLTGTINWIKFET